MAKLNLDVAEQVLLPWDCTIEYRGRDHRVNPPTLKQVMAIDKLGEDSSPKANMQRLDIVAGMFEGGPSAIEDIPMQQLMLSVKFVFNYFKEYSAKNSLAVAQAAANAAAGKPTGGQ